MLHSLSLLFCIYVFGIVSSDEWIQTPHGLRPKECVITHNESNVTINKVNGGLQIYYPLSNRQIFYPTSQKCVDNARDIIANYRNRVKQPMDGWEIYGMSLCCIITK